MGRHIKACKICNKVQAMLDQDAPVPLAECNNPNQATCRRNIAGYEAKMKRQDMANKKALAAENKSGPGADGLADLDGMSVKELKAMCKDLGLKGYSKMKGPELIKLIYQASKAGVA